MAKCDHSQVEKEFGYKKRKESHGIWKCSICGVVITKGKRNTSIGGCFGKIKY